MTLTCAQNFGEKLRILRKSILERKNLEEEEIKTIHVLLAILLDKNNIVSSALRHMKIDYDSVLEEYLNISDIKSKLDDSIENDDDIFGPSESDYQKTEKSKAKLCFYSKNLFSQRISQFFIDLGTNLASIWN